MLGEAELIVWINNILFSTICTFLSCTECVEGKTEFPVFAKKIYCLPKWQFPFLLTFPFSSNLKAEVKPFKGCLSVYFDLFDAFRYSSCQQALCVCQSNCSLLGSNKANSSTLWLHVSHLLAAWILHLEMEEDALFLECFTNFIIFYLSNLLRSGQQSWALCFPSSKKWFPHMG